ncbi:MAG TPA: hypothetical protein VFZ65_06630 [Planctomycetota bacterium]|nr:hypothetical protein [Planctomycetota bacterium]
MSIAPLYTIPTSLLLAAAVTAQGGWSAPVFEPALNSTAADSGPHLSFDGLTLHFASFRVNGSMIGNWEIYSSTRGFPGDAWSAPVPVNELNDPAATDDQPFLVVGDLEIYFASTRAGGLGGFDILHSTRAATNQPWDPPTFVTELNSAGSESSFSLTADGLEAYILTTGWGAPFAPQNAIFRATRPSTGMPFGTPTVVSELLTPNTHRDCEIAPDGLSIVYTEFISPRLKVFYAERPNTGAPFGTPVVWTEFDNVGTLSGVFSFTRAVAGNEAFLAAGFAAAAGGQEIMSTRRSVAYGTGCGAPLPLGLGATAAVLGSNWDFTTTHIDPISPIAVTFFGNTRVFVPIDFLGATGCFAHIDALNGSLTGVNMSGTSVASLPVPLNLVLIGQSLTAQSVCLTLGNAFNLYTSNGIEGTIGY